MRGINVSGQKPIRMVELRSWMEDLGLASVGTYIQTGNIVFDNPERSAKNLAQRIHERSLDRSGFEVPVVMRTKAQSAAITHFRLKLKMTARACTWLSFQACPGRKAWTRWPQSMPLTIVSSASAKSSSYSFRMGQHVPSCGIV
ncbi:MAG: DUF1697 domain-containing protein [Planctomycetes bacterium]|nr:DUF1697 domain-containing protein [Planctomycetota bacterium]